jgi:hypothetical protein
MAGIKVPGSDVGVCPAHRGRMSTESGGGNPALCALRGLDSPRVKARPQYRSSAAAGIG